MKNFVTFGGQHQGERWMQATFQRCPDNIVQVYLAFPNVPLITPFATGQENYLTMGLIPTLFKTRMRFMGSDQIWELISPQF